MTNNHFLLLSLILLLFGCANQKKEYPNAEVAQVLQNTKWNDEFTSVKQLFESKYGLDYNRKVEQEEEGRIAHIFLGGKLNNIETESWTAIFDNDSLNNIIATIRYDSEDKISNDLQKLKDVINSLSYEKYSAEDDFWIIPRNDNSKYGIQLISNDKAILISFSSEKYIDKYSSL